MKKKSLMALLLLATVGNFSSSAYADVTVIIGKPLEVYADPSDVVVGLDTAGPCGSKFFHIQRTNTNFKELTAVVLTAYSSGKSLRLFVASCASDRNILSHGSTFQP
jgi:hypothetical protein